MIKQYTRFIVDAGNNILHCHSQTMPFDDGYNPIEAGDGETIIDVEVETDFDDLDFRTGQVMLKARELIDALEINNGQPAIKSRATRRDKVLNVSAPKSINESAVKAEIAREIESALPETQPLIDEFNRAGHRINRLSELPTIALMRARRSLREQAAQT